MIRAIFRHEATWDGGGGDGLLERVQLRSHVETVKGLIETTVRVVRNMSLRGVTSWPHGTMVNIATTRSRWVCALVNGRAS